MLKLGKARRSLALTAATLSVVGCTTLATSGAAHATTWTEVCGPWQGSTANGAPWYSWQLLPCIDSDGHGDYFSDVYARGGSTDVRLYTGVYDNCNGVTYGLDDNLAYPTTGYAQSYTVTPPPCSKGFWGIARLTESGNGSPWVWSTQAAS